MTTLTIKDMPLNEELDSNDMAAIQGARNISPIARLKLQTSLPAQPPTLDPEGPYGFNGFVLPPGAAD